jgi:Ca-activated chloride channel family protein
VGFGGGMMGMSGFGGMMMGNGLGMMGMSGMSMMGMAYGMTGMTGGFGGMPSTIVPLPPARAASRDHGNISPAATNYALTNPSRTFASMGIIGGRTGGSMMGGVTSMGGMMGMGGGMMGMMGMGGIGGMAPMMVPRTAAVAPQNVADIAKEVNKQPDTAAQKRLEVEGDKYRQLPKEAPATDVAVRGFIATKERLDAYQKARAALKDHRQTEVQSGKLGVDLSVQTQNLRTQSRLEQTAVRRVWGRECLEIVGVWIDQGFTPKTPTLIVKAQSDAYFKLLERQPKLREVFRLGNRLVWVTPSGTALVLDTREGKEKLSDDEIDKLFTAEK